MTKIKDKYTIVQHSGYGYKFDGTFSKGLEVRTISTVGELNLIRKSGGIVFDDWKDADDYCEMEMYKNVPDDPRNFFAGMIPNAPGEFSNEHIDGLRIYIPVQNKVER